MIEGGSLYVKLVKDEWMKSNDGGYERYTERKNGIKGTMMEVC